MILSKQCEYEKIAHIGIRTPYSIIYTDNFIIQYYLLLFTDLIHSIINFYISSINKLHTRKLYLVLVPSTIIVLCT